MDPLKKGSLNFGKTPYMLSLDPVVVGYPTCKQAGCSRRNVCILGVLGESCPLSGTVSLMSQKPMKRSMNQHENVSSQCEGRSLERWVKAHSAVLVVAKKGEPSIDSKIHQNTIIHLTIGTFNGSPRNPHSKGTWECTNLPRVLCFCARSGF